jgi:Ca2+-binding EF-hand superfamily protein
MRTFFFAIGFVVLAAASAGAQLLGGPANKAGDKADDKAAAGGKAAGAKAAAGGKAAKDAPAAPQSNAMFNAIDVNSDGVISKTELRKAIKALQALDADDDGSITLAEASVGGGPIVPGAPLGMDPQIAQLMANDRNNDGKLTVDEVPRDLVPLLQGVDQNQDGALDRAELEGAMANMRNQFGGGPWRGPGGNVAGAGNAQQQATGRFLQYDRNGDGRLTANELPQDASRMLQGADRNNDGAIDAGELQAAIAQQGGRARALRGGVDVDDPRDRKAARGRKATDNN